MTKNFTLRTLAVLAGILAFAASAFAQTKVNNGSIIGRVIDTKNKQPIEYAVISLMSGADSSVVDNAVTDNAGGFTFYRVKGGDYQLKISFLGYKPVRKKVSITAQSPKLALGALEIEPAPITLNEVAVKADAPPVLVKPDTLEFNAGSFKTRENALTEDLLKKLPGIEVDKNGNIKANGEDVKKVYVDGREFFGNDPKIATRNLPANIIDKVQVIDKKSDQAEFTKIDDGQREKVINLKIKEDKKVGLFGNAALGGGYDNFAMNGDNRFDGNLSVNRFNGNQQVSAILNGNNTNKSNFSLQDLGALSGNDMLGSAGGGTSGATRMVMVSGGLSGGQGGSGLDNLSPGGNGITTAGSGGLNFKDKWGKKIDINGSYFYNISKIENTIDNNRTNLIGTGNTFDENHTAMQNNRKNHRLSMNLDYKVDSLSAIKFNPSLSYNSNDQEQLNSFQSLNNALARINDGTRKNTTGFTAPSLNSNFLFMHNFMKRGRNFSVNLASIVNSSKTDAFLQSTTNYYAAPLPADLIDRYQDQGSRVNNQTVRASYTEPLSRSNYLELNYTYSHNYSKADRESYNYDAATSLYDLFDPAMSLVYANTSTINQYGTNFRTVGRKANWTIGMALQRTNLDGKASNLPSAIDRTTYSWLPSANYTYQFTQNRRFAANYRASVRQPSISQLQPIPDNSNPLNIRNGNPDLRPEFNNTFTLNYSNFSMASRKSLFTTLMVQQINDKIGTRVDLDPTTGKRSTTPVNMDGNWLVFGNVATAVPIKPWKTTINFNTGINARRDVNYSNTDLNVTRTLALTQGVSWSYSTSDKFDFYLNLSGTYNRTDYSLPSLKDLNYYDYRASTDFNYNFPAGFKAGFETEYVANTGRGDGFNRNVLLAGASAQKELMNKRATVKFSVNDLFNKNMDITRNVTENAVTDTRSDNIRRYFLLGFSYRFNRFTAGNARG